MNPRASLLGRLPRVVASGVSTTSGGEGSPERAASFAFWLR